MCQQTQLSVTQSYRPKKKMSPRGDIKFIHRVSDHVEPQPLPCGQASSKQSTPQPKKMWKPRYSRRCKSVSPTKMNDLSKASTESSSFGSGDFKREKARPVSASNPCIYPVLSPLTVYSASNSSVCSSRDSLNEDFIRENTKIAYAGAIFNDPPSPEHLPKPPMNWVPKGSISLDSKIESPLNNSDFCFALRSVLRVTA